MEMREVRIASIFLTVLACLVVPLLAGKDDAVMLASPAPELGEYIVASFNDPVCMEPQTMAKPMASRSGECVFSPDFKFYFAISNPGGDIARYRFLCDKGCAPENCSFSGAAPFGSCVQVTINITTPSPVPSASPSFSPNSSISTTTTTATMIIGNHIITSNLDSLSVINTNNIHNRLNNIVASVTFYATAWRVIKAQAMVFGVYNDYDCTMMRPYGQYHIDSALCTYSRLINASFMASYLDARDVDDNRVAYRANCNQDCSSCATYSRTSIGACFSLDNAGVVIDLQTPLTDDGVPTWELVVIIACATGAGVAISLIVLTLAIYLARHIKRRKLDLDYRAINGTERTL